MLNMNEADLIIKAAYLAGLIDGEGSVGFKRSKENRPGRRKPLYYTANIQITNCDLTLLNEVRKIFDCLGIRHSYFLRNMKARNSKWRDAGNVSVNRTEDSAKLLKLILPYLISKKLRAEILLEFCEARIAVGVKGSLPHKEEKRMWALVHGMNSKGPR